MDLARYEKLRRIAAGLSRRASEADDLLQDGLLIAASQGRLPLASEADERWFRGVLRNRAAFDARSAVRRKRREGVLRHAGKTPPGDTEPARLPPMAPGIRAVAALVLHGLDRGEIASALGLSDPTLRQRLAALRKALRDSDPAIARRFLAAAYERRSRGEGLEWGLLRRALRECLQVRGDIGAHDPDGHLLLFSRKDLTQGAPRGNKTSGGTKPC